MSLKAKRLLQKAKRKSRKKRNVKFEAALKLLPDYCSGCGLPLPPGKTYMHDWCR